MISHQYKICSIQVFSQCKQNLKKKMLPRLDAYQSDTTRDVAQFFELNNMETKLESVVKYATSLMIRSRAFGVPVRRTTPPNTAERQIHSRNSTSTRVRRNNLSQAAVRGFSERHNARMDRLVGHITSMTESFQQINASLSQINAMRNNRNE